jgi:hypothetical protein
MDDDRRAADSTVVKLSWAGFYWQEFRARAIATYCYDEDA